ELGGFDVHRVERVGLQLAGALHAALVPDRLDDGLALGERARCNVYVPEQGIVLRALVCHHVSHPTRSDNQDITLHSHLPSLWFDRPSSGQAADVVVIGKLAHEAHAAVQSADGDGRHVDAVEPVLLDHGVGAGIADRDAVADLQRAGEAALAKDVAGKTGLAADLIDVLALLATDRRRFAVDQQTEHVRFGRAVDHREILAVEAGVAHADLERGGVAHRGLAWLEIDLYAPLAGKVAQARAEGVERIARRGKADAATQAHPLQPLQDLAVAALDFAEQRIEAREVAVLAVIVDHHA